MQNYSVPIDINWVLLASGVSVRQAPPYSIPGHTSSSPGPLTESSASEQSLPSPVTENYSTALITETRPSDAWIHRLREELLRINGVECVYMARDRDTVDVWIIIPKRHLNLVRKIAETERLVMRDFVSHDGFPGFVFDFHTVYRGAHQPTDFVPLRAIELPRNK